MSRMISRVCISSPTGVGGGAAAPWAVSNLTIAAHFNSASLYHHISLTEDVATFFHLG